MQYMMLIIGDESRFNTDPGIEPNREFAAYAEALRKAGVMKGGDRLYPTQRSKRVSVREGKTRVIDGPYADTREQVGGYFILECKDDAEAVAYAERCPAARYGTIEIRPIVPR
ncbi:MAG TPA: YciI family protein [Devosia sp.]|nr:YciI family protein [Devosia sp.]